MVGQLMVNAVEAEPLFLAFTGLRFDDAKWRETFKSALAGPILDAANRIDRPGKFGFGLTVSKNLAMLVLAFEGEIDKLLPDHRGYVTQSVRRNRF